MGEPRVLLAYSGDLASSAALAWLLERGAEVATVTIDLGQGRDLNDVRDRALGIGAVRAHVIDQRDTFALHGVAPAWRLPLDEPRAASLARPFIARQTLEIARIEGATAVAHGSAFPADDPAGLEAALHREGLDRPVLVPTREWTMDYEALVAYSRERGIPVPAPGARPMHEVRTLWGRSVTSPDLQEAGRDAPADLFMLTRAPDDWPSEDAVIDVTVAGGLPTALNGVTMSLADLIGSLDVMAGAHGIGRRDYPPSGPRPRTIEEAPASVLLHGVLTTLGDKDGAVRATCFKGAMTLAQAEKRGH